MIYYLVMKKDVLIKEQHKIGAFIRTLRKERNLTQKSFAEKLKTSQSAVARMERGGQNFSTQELIKIGNVLEQPLIRIDKEERDDFIIHGGNTLSGNISTN